MTQKFYLRQTRTHTDIYMLTLLINVVNDKSAVWSFSRLLSFREACKNGWLTFEFQMRFTVLFSDFILDLFRKSAINNCTERSNSLFLYITKKAVAWCGRMMKICTSNQLTKIRTKTRCSNYLTDPSLLAICLQYEWEFMEFKKSGLD